VMNSRRLIGPSLTPRTTPYHMLKKAVLCITQNWAARVGSGSQTEVPFLNCDVRFTPDSDQTADIEQGRRRANRRPTAVQQKFVCLR
jgi:hypothetical protein